MITELILQYPKPSIIVVGAIVTLVSTLVTKWMTDQEHLKALKARQKEIQKEIKKAKPGDKLYLELQSEIMQISGKMMKSSFRPLLITMVPFLLLFYWLRGLYEPLMGFSWFWWYFVSSIVFGMIYRKVFKMA